MFHKNLSTGMDRLSHNLFRTLYDFDGVMDFDVCDICCAIVLGPYREAKECRISTLFGETLENFRIPESVA